MLSFKTKSYLNIIKEIAITDLKLRYEGSVAGYFWSLLKPLFLFGVFYFVFAEFLKIGGDIPNFTIYLLLGIIIWTFFAEVTSVCMGSIVGKGDLIKKVYFPRILLVIANSLTSFMVFLLNLLIVFAFIYFSKIDLDLNAFYFILLLAELYVFALGVSLLLSSLYVRFRDVAHIWEVSLLALFYATPILYPLSLVPDQFAKIIMLSPMAQIIQDSRFILITDQSERVKDVVHIYYYIPYLLPFVIFALGYFTFNKMSAKFAEEV